MQRHDFPITGESIFKNLKFMVLMIIIVLVTTACATKRYPIATPMSSGEAQVLNCENLNLELIRADQIEKQIDETGQFDGRTVIGFLGDFGIGNGMAKDEARAALAERRRNIRDAQVSKGCIKAAPAAPAVQDQTKKGQANTDAGPR